MADRAEWEQATMHQRRLAVAADAELRRRHPHQRFEPLRSAEPGPVTADVTGDLALRAGQPIPAPAAWISNLAAGRAEFARQLAEHQNRAIQPGDPGLDDPGAASPSPSSLSRGAILQPPAEPIPPSPRILALARHRETEIEAAS